MDWYEEEVRALIQRRDELQYKPQTVFYGSSSIRMWDSLYDDFKPFLPVNLGFGGSTLEACVYFFDRIVAPVQSAQKLIVYAGDNDLGDGKSPDEVLYFFKQLENLIKQHFANIPCYYVSIKPSISRWNINENIKQTNALINDEINKSSQFVFVDIYGAMLIEEGYPDKDYFEEDGLHLSKKGYDIWKQILEARIFAVA